MNSSEDDGDELGDELSDLDLEELEEARERNREERLRFVRQWARYVKTHPDEEWSRQQNVIINSGLESARKRVEEEGEDS